jgi:hypothetical protein
MLKVIITIKIFHIATQKTLNIRTNVMEASMGGKNCLQDGKSSGFLSFQPVFSLKTRKFCLKSLLLDVT